MFISVQELQLRGGEGNSFNQRIPSGQLDLGVDVRQITPITTSGRATLVEEREGKTTIPDIRFVGKFSTRLEMKCARCLEPIMKDVGGNFDLLYRPLDADKRPHNEESSISEAETEIGFYEGQGVQLEDVIKEQALLAVPLREICRADCKGLCPQCGSNRNIENCDCSQSLPDARWAALEEIKEKLK